MKKTIIIKPVTRVEGHLDIYIDIGEDDVIVQLKAKGFRGFEKILIGRPIEEVPLIVSRICGFCSAAHNVASVKAIESILGVIAPETAEIVRKIIVLSSVIQSHLLHLGFLLYPDVGNTKDLHGIETPTIYKVIADLYKSASRIVEITGGRDIHPFNVTLGGIWRIPSKEDVSIIYDEATKGLNLLNKVWDNIFKHVNKFITSVVDEIGYVPSTLISLSGKEVEFYDGLIKVVHGDGNELRFHPKEYTKFIAEEATSYSYAKKSFITIGGVKRVYRVGPLPRLLIADMNYEVSRRFYYEFRSVAENYIQHPILYNLARLVEIAYCFEKILALVDELIRSPTVARSRIEPNEGEGVGVIEAPRGLLIHHYRCDERGIITYANIITPTAMNMPAMEIDTKETVKILVGRGVKDYDYIKKRVLYLVRSYDPCISCATHNITIFIR